MTPEDDGDRGAERPPERESESSESPPGRHPDDGESPHPPFPAVEPEDGSKLEGAPRQGEPAGAAQEATGKRRSLGAAVLETAIILVIAAIVAVFIQSFFIKAFLIPSSSMSPTLQVGDRVMVEKVSYYFRKPRRGDIVVFRYPPREPAALNTTNWLYWPFEQIGETLHLTHRGSTPFVKRVVGTAGETVELRKGKLYIDGKRVKENYIVDDNSDFGPVTVPKDSLFCMGDNRPNSRDSRFWGTVPIRSVIGRVFLRWWPLSRFGSPN
jgi:signal peptidase I